MKRFDTTHKFVGQTPLEAMEAWRHTEGISRDVPLAYAGRLDPMASGKLLILIGDECKRQTEYHGFDKEYRFEILLGFRSDTGDILGLAEKATNVTPQLNGRDSSRALQALKGTHNFKYPRFSAKTVRGIPLHEWTLRGGLDDREIPSYLGTVHNIEFENIRSIGSEALLRSITEKINLIPPVTDPRKALGADFRRGEIIPLWNTLLEKSKEDYQIATARAIVSSGTYIRTLSEEFAKQFDTYGLAYSIHRETIGTYRPLIGPFGIWSKRFT